VPRVGDDNPFGLRGLAFPLRGPLLRATAVNFFFCAAMNGFVLLPLYVEQLGGTAAEIGLVMGVYSAVGIVCQPLVGPWVDALGRRPFVFFGVLTVMASALLAAVSSGIGALALVRVIQGLGFSAFFVANFSHVIDLVPVERRGWALGLYGVSGFVSTALAPLVGELVVRWFGFRPLFVLCAAFAGVAAALAFGMREHPRDAPRPVRGAGWARSGAREVFRRHMAVTLFFGLGAGTVFAFMPTFAVSLGVSTLALFYTAYACAAMAVRIFGGRLIDTRGRRAVIVPSMFVQAGSVGLLAVVGVTLGPDSAVPALPALVVCGLMAGGAHGYLYPGLAAMVADQADEARRGFVVGVFSAVYLVGNAGGAMAFGYVAAALGYGRMWALVTACLLLGCGLSLRLAEGAAAPKTVTAAAT
jgi:MFS family permease